ASNRSRPPRRPPRISFVAGGELPSRPLIQLLAIPDGRVGMNGEDVAEWVDRVCGGEFVIRGISKYEGDVVRDAVQLGRRIQRVIIDAQIQRDVANGIPVTPEGNQRTQHNRGKQNLRSDAA